MNNNEHNSEIVDLGQEKYNPFLKNWMKINIKLIPKIKDQAG